MSNSLSSRRYIFKPIILLLNIILLVVLLNSLPFTDLQNKGLAIVIFVAVLWLTETLHITVTALLIPVLAIFLGVFNTQVALSGFANPIIFLFLAGFAIATALNEQGIDRYIALKILHLSKGNYLVGCIGIFLVTFFLSMWISNTSTTAMILPIALGILRNLDPVTDRRTFIFLVLGIAYSASIGGLTTSIGSTPNGITVAATGLDFAGYFKMAAPISFISLPLMIIILYLLFRPKFQDKFELEKIDFRFNRKSLITIILFAFIVLSWAFGAYISKFLSYILGVKTITKFDTIVSLVGTIALCSFKVTSWQKVQQTTNWGLLILFGGGVILGDIIKVTGVTGLLASGIQNAVADANLLLIALILSAIIVVLTEFMSNTASAALLVPIFISFASASGLNPISMAMIIGVGANAAFMLPIATGPNALAYGTGFLKQSDMLKAGIILNIVFFILLAFIARYYWGLSI